MDIDVNTDILVPITLLVVVMVIIKTLMTYRHKKLVLWHQTLSGAIEQGHALDVDTMKRLARAVDPQRQDLRRAILFFCLALILCFLCLALPFGDPDGQLAVAVIACIPFGFSLVYLGFWKFWHQ